MRICVGDEGEEMLNILKRTEQFHPKNYPIQNDNGISHTMEKKMCRPRRGKRCVLRVDYFSSFPPPLACHPSLYSKVLGLRKSEKAVYTLHMSQASQVNTVIWKKQEIRFKLNLRLTLKTKMN